MPNYSYTAKDSYGKSVKGNLEAENEKGVYNSMLYCVLYLPA